MAVDLQPALFELDDALPTPGAPVLGRHFSSDAERHAEFSRALAKQLSGHLRALPGFPNAADAEILAMSDAPWATLCPNPFWPDAIAAATSDRLWQPPDKPFAGSLLRGRRHPVHAFHPYHTKVPPEAIRSLIEYYAPAGGVVLDPFAGSGMTGVAARDCGRTALLCDLSPAAAFTAGINCTAHDWRAAVRALEEVIAESRRELGHLYVTDESGAALEVNYFVWSDVFDCPTCGTGFPFFPHGVIHHGTKVETRSAFPCPGCRTELNVRRVRRRIGPDGKESALVWVNAGTGAQRVNRAPRAADLALADSMRRHAPEAWYPREPIDPAGYSARLAQLGDKQISDVSRFLSPRNLAVYADLWARVRALHDGPVRMLCQAALTSIHTVISERQGYFGGGGGMSGNFYMPIVRMEKNVYDVLLRKLPKLVDAERHKALQTGAAFVSTQSATDLRSVPDDSVDYVYTDPPFGSNIIYSEMNLIMEAWLGVRTEATHEAVVDDSRGRGIDEYGELMRLSLQECHRVLKPGRWLTLQFHNTDAVVWNTLQSAMRDAGFEAEAVSVLDKGSTTLLGDIRPNSAKHDLLIYARKPRPGRRSSRAVPLPSLDAWKIVHQRLAVLPRAGDGVTARERTHLFNHMVGEHLAAGLPIPMSSGEFNRGLEERFVQRGRLWFLREDTAVGPDAELVEPSESP